MTADKQKVKLGERTGFWVLVATISASSMAFIGQFSLTTVQPAIQEGLGASGGELIWIVNIYSLMLGALILIGGSMGDHFGRKRVYVIGIVTFAITSIICGFVESTELLIFFRLLQGIGGALMIPGSLAIISSYFDDEHRGAAIGQWASATTLASIVGPVLGGIFADIGFWRGVFFIALPFAAVSLYALHRYVPESRDEQAAKGLDWTGSILVTLGMFGIVFGAIQIGEVGPEGLSNPLFVGAILVGLALMVAFVWWEARSPHPMMPLKLFKSRTFSGANLLTLFLYGALGGALFFLPLNLQQVHGYSATLSGLANLPLSILLTVMSPWAGTLVAKYGPRPPLIIGPTIVGFGFLMLAFPYITSGPADYWLTYFPGSVLFGIGMGITVAPLTTSVMGAVPQQNSGTASGINNAISRSAGTLAVSIMGGIALLFFSGSLDNSVQDLGLPQTAYEQLLEDSSDLAATGIPEGLDETAASGVQTAINRSFVDTFRLMMLIGAGSAWLSALLAFLVIERKLKPPKELVQQAQPAAAD
mgnify:CR=1 FL=1